MDKIGGSIIQNKNGDYSLQFYHILFSILDSFFNTFTRLLVIVNI